MCVPASENAPEHLCKSPQFLQFEQHQKLLGNEDWLSDVEYTVGRDVKLTGTKFDPCPCPVLLVRLQGEIDHELIVCLLR